LRRRRNLAKVSVILLVLIAVTVAAVLGIVTLIKTLASVNTGQITDDPKGNPSVSQKPENNEQNEPTETSMAPVENKVLVLNFENDILTVQNPGANPRVSHITGNHTLVLEIYDRISEKYGDFDLSNSTYFESMSISEEENGTRIVLNAKSDFNIVVESNEENYVIRVIDVQNAGKLIYRNDLDRHYMAIDSAALCARSDSEIVYYEEYFDSYNLVKKLVIPKKNMPALNDEKVILNDGYLKSYEIKNVDDDIVMIFTLEEDLTLYPNARDYNSTLTFIKNRTEENLIVIDPGHGGLDGGTVSAGEVLIEKNIVLDISAFLAEELRARGFNVYNLREEDVFLGLKERTDIANHLGASSVISVHVNAYDDTSVNGSLTMYKDSLDLARSIQNNLVASIRSTDIGLVKMMDRAILNGAKMDSVIVEIGFLSNPIEAEKLNIEEYQRKASAGIADGIAEYYENKENTDGTQGN